MTDQEYYVKSRRGMVRMKWIKRAGRKLCGLVRTVEGFFLRREIRHLQKLDKAWRQSAQARG